MITSLSTRLLASAAMMCLPTAAMWSQDSVKTAVADTTVTVTFGGFVDVYGAYDTGRPRSLDRAFTTQAVRHNEFNVNLAFVEAVVSGPRVRGRLALQTGTSVQANYSGEPRIGSVSGPELGRLIQEAYVGYQVTPALWVDAGVFFSNVGMEGWVSRDNPIYTRSLVADYSPYYSSGVRATWQVSSRVSVRADLVNGWQNISESNEDKALGARVDFAVTPSTTLSWYGLAGNEPGARLRLYNGVGIKTRPTTSFEVTAELDAGREEAPDSIGTNAPARTWYGGMLIARWTVSPRSAVVGRLERYVDDDQVILSTGIANPLRANGASIGFDFKPASRLLWRSEARVLRNPTAVFPDRHASGGVAKRNTVFVSSLALTF